ncbi:hypothetical protein [Citricoccus sp. NR2]|uniref:hypothetical protein n=1 Tax=Citricoccus sp. NR2 TaxID=3004095 RepID=UPI0022DD57C3|nr:hypothetical protein [Citricoccus sp. NR2]WBL18490.1 hypothetical protein O1A05_12080 [Citricoccus sp. NR2]
MITIKLEIIPGKTTLGELKRTLDLIEYIGEAPDSQPAFQPIDNDDTIYDLVIEIPGGEE